VQWVAIAVSRVIMSSVQTVMYLYTMSYIVVPAVVGECHAEHMQIVLLQIIRLSYYKQNQKHALRVSQKYSYSRTYWSSLSCPVLLPVHETQKISSRFGPWAYFH